MYIEPNSIIKIYSGMPLDNSYAHTLWFDTINYQRAFFHEQSYHLKHTLSRQYYNRVERGRLRVQINAEDLYDCNYLAFQNTGYYSAGESPKWFYAFIVGVEFVNNVTSEITFEIDIMQTYLFDADLKSSFVVREHSATDVFGENLVEENINTGSDFVSNNQPLVLPMSPNYVGVQLTEYTDGEPIETIHVDDNKLASATLPLGGWNITSNDGVVALGIFFSNIKNKETIINMFQMPECCWSGNVPYCQTYGSKGTKEFDSNLSTIDGYSPRNKKLFTYPYNFILFTNNSGDSSQFRYELFKNDDGSNLKSGDKVKFYYKGACFNTPQVLCYPANYRGISEDYESGLIMNDFPQVPFNSDVYKAYIAQNKGNIIASQIGSMISTMVAAYGAVATGGTSLAALGSVSLVASKANQAKGVADTMGTVSAIKAQPETALSLSNVDSVKAFESRFKYSYYRMSIHSDVAKTIDDYFSMYGYATNRIKIPNRSSRPRFNYVQTSNATIVGRMPADDIAKLEYIYNNGITFWKQWSDVGNYSDEVLNANMV